MRCLFLFACTLVSCVGTTGGEVVDFQAAAAGPEGAMAGAPLEFESSRGWQIRLTTARMHVGAVYLSDSLPPSGAQASSCILPGSYVAQIIEGRDVDLLSGEAQLFPVLGHGTTVEAQAAQVWLTGGDVNDVSDPSPPTIVLELAGSAHLGNLKRPFTAALTIAGNRVGASGAAAGADPICIERIVTPIPSAVQVRTEGALLLRIDPRQLFTNLDFSTLPASPDGETYTFTDDREAADQASVNLYYNLKQTGPLYALSWVASLK